MEKSYDEILHILKLNGRSDLNEIVYRGSTRYLPDEKTPVISPAAEDMVERSRDYDAQNPLVIVAIGAITNVASAILLDPTILERVVIVWLGGNCNEWHDYHEFNLEQDVAAARIVLSIMLTCGMYDGSGDFAIRVGVPAKSGVGGGIMAVVPGRMGVGLFGPALDEKGNSLAGIRALELLSARLDLSVF